MLAKLKTIQPFFLIYLAAVILFPLFGGDYTRSVGVITGLHALVAIGLGLLMGSAGQISLGQAGFWGIGAYTSAVLSMKLGIPPVISIIIGAIFPGIVAFVVARAISGLQGYYLAMATLAFGYIIQIAITEWEPVTGGANGLISIPSIGIVGIEDSEAGYYYLVWTIVTLALLFTVNILNSRIGRALRAIHKSEIAATSMGVNVAKYKLQSFVISGVFAGISGGLYAHYIGILDPQPFGLSESIKFLTMVVIGGMTSVWGALFGAVIINAISELIIMLSEHFSWVKGDFETIFFGGILVVIIMFMPEGLVVGLQTRLLKKRHDQSANKVITEGSIPDGKVVRDQ